MISAAFSLRASIIRAEEDVGGLDEFLAGVARVVGVFQIVHDAAQAPVHGGDHGGEVGVLLAR